MELPVPNHLTLFLGALQSASKLELMVTVLESSSWFEITNSPIPATKPVKF